MGPLESSIQAIWASPKMGYYQPSHVFSQNSRVPADSHNFNELRCLSEKLLVANEHPKKWARRISKMSHRSCRGTVIRFYVEALMMSPKLYGLVDHQSFYEVVASWAQASACNFLGALHSWKKYIGHRTFVNISLSDNDFLTIRRTIESRPIVIPERAGFIVFMKRSRYHWIIAGVSGGPI